MTVRLERVAAPDVPWAELDRREDRTPYQTREWSDVLAAAHGTEPVVARVRLGDQPIGWFTSAVGSVRGVRVLGAPLRGWSTGPMGFNLDQPVPPEHVATGLRSFAFRSLGCHHLEVMSRAGLSPMLHGFRDDSLPGYRLDLDPDVDQLFAGMSSMARRNVRRAERRGVEVHEVDPVRDPGFAAQLHSHLMATFALRGTVPRSGEDLIRTVARLVHPTGHLLALRAVTADGTTAATGLFPGLAGGGSGMWMAAGDPTQRVDRPNEALMWAAITGWRRRGASWFEFGGGGAYKAKFGGRSEEVPWLRTSRWPGMERARALGLWWMRR